VVSSKEEIKKVGGSLETAHLPPTASHLLLQALFIYSSPGRMSLLFSPVYNPTHLLQLPSFLHEEWPSLPPVVLPTQQLQLQAFPCASTLRAPFSRAWGALTFLLCVFLFIYFPSVY
jgi:hypothetical protein